jgi:RNA polymerase sigma-B factor
MSMSAVATGLSPSCRSGVQASSESLFENWQQQADRAARDALVERFLPLARKLARRYAGGQEPIEDLIQVASLGLVKAIDRFDPARGNRFPAFAVPTILGELRRHFRDTSWAVHVSRATQERSMEVQQAMDLLLTESGRSPSVREVAEYLELDSEQVLEAMQVGQAHSALSLDAPGGGGEEDGEGDARIERIGTEDECYDFVDCSSVVEQALAELEPRERQILGLRFFAEMTQSEIALEVGLSQMQVSRLLRRSLERMRQAGAEADLSSS